MQTSDFFDRNVYLDILEKRTKAAKAGYRQNIAIIGDKDIGKTSVILHFLNQFNDPMILPLYLELGPELSWEQFVRKFIGSLLYNFLENSNVARNEDLDFLISKASRFIPKTIEAIKLTLSLLKKRKSVQNLFIQLLSLCDILNLETGKFCVIIFDEFHYLGTLGIKQIYKQFAKMLMIQKKVLYIILSSAKFKAKKILSSHLALLFGNFEIIEMQSFDLKTTEEFLSKRLAHLQMEKSLIDFLIHFTGGHPLYLKIITDSLLRFTSPVRNTTLPEGKTKISNGTSPITKEKLAEIIQDLLFVESGILNQRFRLANLKLTQDYQELLYLIADGQNRLKDLATNLHKSKTQILSRLNLLLEYDVIDKSGDFFIISDRIFNFWLRFVYREKLNSLTFNTEEQKKNFRMKIEEKINQFILANRKSVLERMMELLHLFENELIQLRTKKFRLVQFQEIKPLTFLHSRLNEGLIARSKDSLWIMAVKREALTEEDIVDFTKQCRRFHYAKPQKKVIVTNYSIDTNARLKAMEEKVLTWNLDDLNLILDLYNKPRVIL